MTHQGPHTFHRIEQLFHRAAELEGGARAAFLDAACTGEPAIRAEVEALLEHAARAAPFSSGGTGHPLRDLEPDVPGRRADPSLQPGTQMGSYRILEHLGEGGMGEVYRAEQLHPLRREVALKLVKAGMDTRQVLRRFALERQALARMDHPGIARVFDAGVTAAGRPFFAMELVDGEPLTAFCDRERLDVKARLELMVRVCEAVQHAHQRGILHRDLKPSNLLARRRAGTIDVTVIDFGIAKALIAEDTGGDIAAAGAATRAGQVVGTPAYMSPEQADPSRGVTDTRSDVYALGVVLYELLTGALPSSPEEGHGDAGGRTPDLRVFDPPLRPSARVARGAGADAVAAARSTHPEALARRLRGDLDWIAAKALEEDPARRYAAASELAADLERHLRHQPVEAAAPSWSYRAGKLVQRHRLAVVTAALVSAAVVTGTVLALVGLVRATRAEAVARAEAARAARETAAAREVADFLVDLFDSSLPRRRNPEEITARELLDEGAARVERELVDQPLVRARLLHTLGVVHERLGLAQRARELLEQAVALREAHLPPGDLELAESLRELAVVHNSLDLIDRAEELAKRAVASLENRFGPEHPALADSLRTLGRLRLERSRLDEALALLERSLRVGKAAPAPDDRSTAATLRLLGGVLAAKGERERARDVLAEALALHQRDGGTDDVRTADLLVNLGNAEYAVGTYGEAQRRYEGALAIYERVLGPEHHEVGRTLQNLANVAQRTGELETARSLLDRSIAVKELALGPAHTSVAAALTNLGNLEVELGRYEDAETRFERARGIFEAVLGPDHPNVSYTLVGLGDVRGRRGDFAGALPLYERASALRASGLGESHAHTWLARYAVARTLTRMGRFEPALPLYRDALLNLEAQLEPDHPFLAAVCSGYGELLLAMGRPVEAEAQVRRALAIAESVQGTDHPNVADILETLAGVLRAVDREEEAEQASLRARTIRRASGGDAELLGEPGA